MSQQPARLGPLSGLGLHFCVQLLDSLLQLHVQTQELISSLTGVGWQRQGLQCALPRPTPQRMALAQGVIESDRLQGVLQSRSHPHPPVSVPQQGSQVPLFDRWHPNLREAIISASFVPSPFGWNTAKCTRFVCEADVAMTSVIRAPMLRRWLHRTLCVSLQHNQRTY